MQYQILINIGLINLIFIMWVFFTDFFHRIIVKLLFDDCFHIAFGYTISFESSF